MSESDKNEQPKFSKLLRTMGKAKEAAARKAAEPKPCCAPKIHVAFRGVSDDRLYLSRNRDFGELKFFKPNGLRVFCAGCRKRL
jgi:hypothetical protein